MPPELKMIKMDCHNQPNGPVHDFFILRQWNTNLFRMKYLELGFELTFKHWSPLRAHSRLEFTITFVCDAHGFNGLQWYYSQTVIPYIGKLLLKIIANARCGRRSNIIIKCKQLNSLADVYCMKSSECPCIWSSKFKTCMTDWFSNLSVS